MTTNHTTERAREALANAQTGQSAMNYPAIFAGFLERGYDESDIRPRENVFTFAAWKALGRVVKRGEHGVRILTWVPIAEKTDESTGEVIRPAGRRPRTTTVFHYRQTKALDA